MEPLLFFLKGVAAGFVVAAPVGPVAVLCIRRTLTHGMMSGYATGMGAAIADTIYGMIAAYGVSFIADLLFDNETGFRLVGGAILMVMGVRMWRARPKDAGDRGNGDLIGDFFSAMVVTATNPITLVAFGVVFATIGVATAGENFDWAEALIAGVLLGATAWWISLTWLAALCHKVMGGFPVTWVNRISGIVILSCGAVVLIGAFAPDSIIGRLIDFPG